MSGNAMQDVSILSSPLSHDPSNDGPSPQIAEPVTAGSVISRIEGFLEQILDQMTEENELSIKFSSRNSGRRHEQQIHYPGRTIHEAKKFTRILLILQLAHDALVSGNILTKRHIYYQHQNLFESQRVVDDLVDDLALTLDIARDDLNIVASAKGLFSGPLAIRLSDGTLVDSSLGDVGTPLPIVRCISEINFGTIRWILVVEKDAIFRSLTSARYWQTSTLGPGLLITAEDKAKGYPDLMTLSFLRLVQSERSQIPISILVDFDPDGLNIFRCYRFGSAPVAQAQHHESGKCSHGAALKSIRLLGIKAQQVLKLDSITSSSLPDPILPESQSSESSKLSRTSISSTNCRDPISLLSFRDRKHAVKTLERTASITEDDYEACQLRHQLQLMLMMGVKAEIQWLDEAGSIAGWLDVELRQMMMSSRS